MTKVLLILAWLVAVTAAVAQPGAAGSGRTLAPVGIFEDHLDIGNPKMNGDASYDATTQVYSLKGGGANIWFNKDEFHFVYKKIKGDFILTADFEFTGDTAGAVGHRKIGWMIRESTDEGAASANACKHIDGLVVLQWRPYRGMFMRDPEEERSRRVISETPGPIDGYDTVDHSPDGKYIYYSSNLIWRTGYAQDRMLVRRQPPS